MSRRWNIKRTERFAGIADVLHMFSLAYDTSPHGCSNPSNLHFCVTEEGAADSEAEFAELQVTSLSYDESCTPGRFCIGGNLLVYVDNDSPISVTGRYNATDGSGYLETR